MGSPAVDVTLRALDAPLRHVSGPDSLRGDLFYLENLTMRSLTLSGAAMLAAALLTGCAGDDAPTAPPTPEAAGPLQPKVLGVNGQIAFNRGGGGQ